MAPNQNWRAKYAPLLLCLGVGSLIGALRGSWWSYLPLIFVSFSLGELIADRCWVRNQPKYFVCFVLPVRVWITFKVEQEARLEYGVTLETENATRFAKFNLSRETTLPIPPVPGFAYTVP